MKKITFIFALVLFVCFSACTKYDDESDFRIAVLDGGKTAEIVEYTGNNQIVSIPLSEGWHLTGVPDLPA